MSPADAPPPDDVPAGPAGAPLSPEAQLATALLLQARALERGLAGRDAGPVLRSRELVGLLRKARADRAEQAEAAARRERRLLLAAGAAALAAVLSAGTAAWAALQRDAGPAEPPVVVAPPDREAETLRLEQAVAAAVGRAWEEQQAARQEVESALTEADRRAADARQALEQLEVERDELADALAGQQATRETLEKELETARDERLEQIGENARLVEQVLERDRQLAELRASLAGFRDVAAKGLARPAGLRVTHGPEGGPSGLAARVGAALAGSGVVGVQVAEADGPEQGALLDLLLVLVDPQGGQRVVEAQHAALASDGRGLQLLCTGPGTPDGEPFAIGLPEPDLDAWAALGLPLPPGYLDRVAVVVALTAVVEPHGWSVAALTAWDGETLWGLELRRPEPGGGARVVRAARAELSAVGPELVLEDGSIELRGEERPFYDGVYRIALPGADYGSWMAAVDPLGS